MTINWKTTRDAVTAAVSTATGATKDVGKKVLADLNLAGQHYDHAFPPPPAPGRDTLQVESSEHIAWRASLVDLNEIAALVDGKPVPDIGPDDDGPAALAATQARLKAILDSDDYSKSPLRGLVETAYGVNAAEPLYFVAAYYLGLHGRIGSTTDGTVEKSLLDNIAQAEAWLGVL